MFCLDVGGGAAIAFDDAALAVLEPGPTRDDLDTSLLQQPGDATIEFLHDAVLPVHGAAQVELWGLRQANAQGAFAHMLLQGVELAGGVNQCLGRDAAADQAGAAELVCVHQHGLQAQLPGADGGNIAAGPATDNQDLGA